VRHREETKDEKESCTALRQLDDRKPAGQGSWQCLHVFAIMLLVCVVSVILQ
jgi:hypothetical protein